MQAADRAAARGRCRRSGRAIEGARRGVRRGGVARRGGRSADAPLTSPSRRAGARRRFARRDRPARGFRDDASCCGSLSRLRSRSAGIVDPAFTLSGASRARVGRAWPLSIRRRPPAADRPRTSRPRSGGHRTTSFRDATSRCGGGDRDRRSLSGRTAVPDVAMLVADGRSRPSRSRARRTGVRIVRVDAPREVPPATVIHVDVELEGARRRGTDDRRHRRHVAGLEVGRASHRWTQRQRALARGHRRGSGRRTAVRRSGPAEAGHYRMRDRSVAEPVGAMPVVSGFSRTVGRRRRRRSPRLRSASSSTTPRPSWATTFVRRALEADARFQVATLSFTSRGVSAQTGGAVPLGDPRLDALRRRRSSAASIVCRPPMSARSIASCANAAAPSSLVPDQRIDAGPRAISSRAQELDRTSARAAGDAGRHAAGRSLRASELLVLRSLLPVTDVIARMSGADASAAEARR